MDEEVGVHEEKRKTPAWRGVGFLALVQKQLEMHQPCLCSVQQGCWDCCQLQLPEDYPGLSFCQPELVGEVAELVGEVGELADWKDVFPQVSPMPVPAWLGQLLFATALEECQAFSVMKDF